MGFFDQTSSRKAVRVTALLPGFQAQGELQVIGLLQIFLNDEQRDGFTLLNAMVHGLQADNPATSLQLDEVYLRKDTCQLVAFEDEFSKDESGLLMRSERLVVYTPHYAVQGHFHMGATAELSEFMAGSTRLFVAATDVTIFPLFRAPTALIRRAPLVFMHRDAAQMHHKL